MNKKTQYTSTFPDRLQPKGVAYFFGTVSGLIIVVNTAVYILMSGCGLAEEYANNGITLSFFEPLLLPSVQTVLDFGAMSLAHVVNGQWWRFFTPMFIHIGLVHFLLNTIGIYYIGYQLEKIVGKKWFLFIYLASGVAGTIVSANFNLKYSAGASGAIFGLLGLGFCVEKIVNSHIKKITGSTKHSVNAYGTMIFLNLVIGFLIPFVDNSAHVGGFLAGFVLSLACFLYRGTKFSVPRKKPALLIFCLVFVVSFAGAVLASSKNYALHRFINQSNRLLEQMIQEGFDLDKGRQVYAYTADALSIDGSRDEVLFLRGELFLVQNDVEYAVNVFRMIIEKKEYLKRIQNLSERLKAKGQDMWVLDQLIHLYSKQ